MPEYFSIETVADDNELQFLCRIKIDGPGSLDGMGTGALVFDQGDIEKSSDDEVYIATAAHVAGNYLDGPQSGMIEMYVNGKWKEIDRYDESDVYLYSDTFVGDSRTYDSTRVSEDIALIKMDNLDVLSELGISFENLLAIPDEPFAKLDEIYGYGASITFDQPRKFIIDDYTSGITIRTDDELGVHGDSGGPLVAKEGKINYLIGILRGGLGPNSVEQIFPDIGEYLPEEWIHTCFVNLQPEHYIFFEDVFENGQNSEHYDIDDLEKTFVEALNENQKNLIMLTIGVTGLGVLAIYGLGSAVADIVALTKKTFADKKKVDDNY